MRARSMATLVALGLAAALGLTAPAAAADAAPTISVPASRKGYGDITITGTAAANATVELYESAYLFNDFYPSPNYSTGGVVTAKATSAGKYTIVRTIDSGFRFYVMVDGVASSRAIVKMEAVPTLRVTTASNGSVTATVSANPAQPGLGVHIQSGVSGVWTTRSGGYIGEDSSYTTTLTNQGAGSTKWYRAVIDADPDNGILTGHSATVQIVVGGGSAGTVQFSRIQYAAPGALNNEWVRLTNKTKKTINLKGWTVRDRSAHIYTFGTAYNLGAGASVYLLTGKGTNGKPVASYRFWGSTGYIWNNTGDAATLRSPANKNIDSCSWGNGSGVTAC